MKVSPLHFSAIDIIGPSKTEPFIRTALDTLPPPPTVRSWQMDPKTGRVTENPPLPQNPRSPQERFQAGEDPFCNLIPRYRIRAFVEGVTGKEFRFWASDPDRLGFIPVYIPQAGSVAIFTGIDATRLVSQTGDVVLQALAQLSYRLHLRKTGPEPTRCSVLESALRLIRQSRQIKRYD